MKDVGVPLLRPGLTLQQVDEFARKARWQVHCGDARAHRARCLDGRYKPGAGVIAMPGADIGVLAIAFAGVSSLPDHVGGIIDAEQLAAIVFGVVGGMLNFSYHTDRPSLAGQADRYDGCSYCRLLVSKPALFAPYSLDAVQLTKLHQILGGLEREHIKPDILRGGHDEGAVLFVQNVRDLDNCEMLSPDEIRRSQKLWVLDNYAVLRGIGRRRAFVYQRDLAESRIAELADALGRVINADVGLLDLMRRRLQEIGNLHVSRVLKDLAGDLPFFNVFIDAESGAIAKPERIV
jgi:hypothetical protein